MVKSSSISSPIVDPIVDPIVVSSIVDPTSSMPLVPKPKTKSKVTPKTKCATDSKPEPESVADTELVGEGVDPCCEETSVCDDGKKDEEDAILCKLNFMSEKLFCVTTVVKEMSATMKILQKEYLRLKKNNATALASAQGSRKGIRRKKTGVQKPPCQGHISADMSDFLAVPSDHMMSRRDVIRGLNLYIKEKSLQSPQDGRIILPDERLKKLLDVPLDIDLTYFNMQKYINPHFSAVIAKKDNDGPVTSNDTTNGGTSTDSAATDSAI